uniref:Uncharacterized protein n=1 Tax=Anguilla anguilla TaxID=7936 RepID=A0A0E9PYH6_ANGAN
MIIFFKMSGGGEPGGLCVNLRCEEDPEGLKL